MRPTNGSSFWGLYGQLVLYIPNSELIEDIRSLAVKNIPPTPFVEDELHIRESIRYFVLLLFCEPDPKNYLIRARELKTVYTILCMQEGEEKSFKSLRFYANKIGYPHDWKARVADGWPRCPLRCIGRPTGVKHKWATSYREMK